MYHCREWDGAPQNASESSGTPQGLMHAIACAVFQFSATPSPEGRDMLSAGLQEWLSTAREPNLSDRDLPRPAW
jgi:hypothetical protein